MEGKVLLINFIYFIMNLIGLVVFLFLVKLMIVVIIEIFDEIYCEMIEERKRLIFLWVNVMLKVK